MATATPRRRRAASRSAVTAWLASALALTAAAGLAGCKPEVPTRWAELGVPTKGLEKVLPETGEHGFYAEYAGIEPKQLLDSAVQALADRGYELRCNFRGEPWRGLMKGMDGYIVKVDGMGPVRLSVSGRESEERQLWKLCFAPEPRIVY